MGASISLNRNAVHGDASALSHGGVRGAQGRGEHMGFSLGIPRALMDHGRCSFRGALNRRSHWTWGSPTPLQRAPRWVPRQSSSLIFSQAVWGALVDGERFGRDMRADVDATQDIRCMYRAPP